MNSSGKRNPETAGKRRPQATAYRLFLQFDVSADQPPRVVEETRRVTEFHEDIITRVCNEWQACQSDRWPDRSPPVGQVTIDIHLTKRPTRLSQAEGLLLLNEVAAGVRPIFHGGGNEALPIDLPFARGGLTFKVAPATPDSVLAKNVAEVHDFEKPTSSDNGLSVTDDIQAGDETPSPPLIAVPAAIRPEAIALQEKAAEQLQLDLVSRLKGLMFPSDPEEKAKFVLGLNRDLNQAFWTELRNELVPLIKPLLQHIPSNYAGKQIRCSLVNKLLEVFGLSIAFRDEAGNIHECTVHASRARESDPGRLRLRERRLIRGVRGNYPVPPVDQMEIIDATQPVPHEEQVHGHANSAHSRDR